MSGYLFHDESNDWRPHPRVPGVAIKPLVTAAMNPELTVSQVKLPPGADIPPHTHDTSTETFYILSGKALCRVADEERILYPGDGGYAPPGVVHTVRNTGEQDLLAISIFNPPLP